MAPQGNTQQPSEVSNTATFQQPYPHAQLNGRSVRLIALGDAEGKSPAFLYVDEEGHTNWESQSKFTIVDQNIQAQRSMAGSTTSSSNR